MVLDQFFNLSFGWAMTWSPLGGLILVSFLLTLLISVIYKYMTDQELMKSLKEEIKEIQKDLKKFKDDPSKAMHFQKRAMEKNMKYMMHSMKPTLITFVPIIIIFGWLRKYYISIGDPDLFLGFGWLGTYIIFSIVFSIAIRKVLKIH